MHKRFCIYALAAWAVIFSASEPATAQVTVRHAEGLIHGYLTLRTLQGETIAEGDLIQNAQDDRVTTHVIFRFKDGSLHDDTTIFSQREHFRLLTSHLIQKGPAFKEPKDVMVNCETGQISVRYTENGQEKRITERLQLPADLSNGLVTILLKNIPQNTARTEVSFLASTPKPRLVKLVITPEGEQQFFTGDTARKATRYAVKVQIGGLSGALASLLGKKPPDTHVWILQGEAPAFVKSQGPLAHGGPIWSIELMSPNWPRALERKSIEKE